MFGFLEEADVLGNPLGVDTEIVIDWPDVPPISEASDDELIRAVREVGGHVFVGFKEAALPHLAETVTGPAGARQARIRPIAGTTIEAGRSFVRSRGGVITRPYRAFPFVAATIEPGVAPELRRHPLVDWVAPQRRASVLGAPAVAASRDEPQVLPDHLHQILALHAWNANLGEGGRIWILDVGTFGGFSHHPDLPQLNPHTCITMVPTDDPVDACKDTSNDTFTGHGSAVAGAAVALDNTMDIAGVAPAVGFWGSIRVCESGQQSDCISAPNIAPEQGVVDALEFLRQNGAKDVINMSLGFTDFSQALATAAALAWDGGDLLVAAAGNSSTQAVNYPAALDSVIAVSGVDGADNFAGTTSGPEVELSAPYHVLTLHMPGAGKVTGTAEWQGTSFSTALVSGTAALIWTKNPGWSNAQVRTKLQTSVKDLGPHGRDEEFGFRRIDACLAVDVCGSP